MWTCRHLNDLVGALAGGWAPGGHVAVAAAPLLLQIWTVTVLISVFTGVGWRNKKMKKINGRINKKTLRKH